MTIHFENIERIISQVLAGLNDVIFFSIGGMPLIVLWLIFPGVFFTLRMKFVNIRAFKHAIDVVRGKYDDPNSEAGEVSHFQALAVALSGTVGLGNIAGVATAIGLGGPGAVFWITVGGLLAMTTKFTECTLGQKYRIVASDGRVRGGPMYYLSAGLAEMKLIGMGKILAALFCFLMICGFLGSSCIFQSNQSLAAVAAVLPFFADKGWVYGLILVSLVASVILGGIQRLAQVTGAIVPLMCTIYIVASLWVLLTHLNAIPGAIATIISDAFSFHAVGGGFAGALIQGLRRSTFSNEAGLGTAPIAHATAKTSEPVREGIVALLEPFIDTVIICNLTALVIIITGVYDNPELAGSQLASAAFGEAIGWFPYVLAIALCLFSFSTLISVAYYGQVGWEYLFSPRSTIIFQVSFLAAIWLGSVASPQAVLQFADAISLAKAFPNLLGIYILSNQVAADLEDYLHRLNTGQMHH